MKDLSGRLRMNALRRFHGVGEIEYGPYKKGKYSLTERCRMAREEIEDAWVYLVEMGRVDAPQAEYERGEVMWKLEQVYEAIDRLERDEARFAEKRP